MEEEGEGVSVGAHAEVGELHSRFFNVSLGLDMTFHHCHAVYESEAGVKDPFYSGLFGSVDGSELVWCALGSVEFVSGD